MSHQFINIMFVRLQALLANSPLVKLVVSTFALVAFGITTQAVQAAEQGIEEVVVTAQYRAQKLQETPLAISAYTGDQLADMGAADTNDIDMFVPSAVIQPLGAGWGSTVAAFIRGIGLNDNILSYEPGVPIYIDDVYLGRNQGAVLDLLDLERVEVLRGPQGTLFGKNAIGGAVRFISRKPSGSGGNVSVTVGERNRLNLRGMLDVEVVPDKLYARISGSSKTQDGYFDILDYECVNGAGSLGGGGDGSSPIFPGLSINLGSAVSQKGNCVVDHLGNENVQSGRAMVLWHAAPDIDVTLSADVTHQRQKGPADKYERYYQKGTGEGFIPDTLWNTLVGVPVFGIPWDSRFMTDSPYTNYNTYVDPISGRTFPNVNNLDEWGVAGTIEWNINPNLTFKSITSYRTFKNSFGRTSSGSPIPVDLTWDVTRHEQVTEEIRLTGTSFDRLNWTAGFFYYTAKDSNYQSGSLFPGIIYQQDSYDSQDAENWALFVHGIYDITDKLSLTLGVRYTDDKKNALISRYNFDGTDRLPVPGFTTQTSPGPVNISETNLSPKVGLDYQVTDDLLLFAFYSTGFRGGGFSPRPANALQLANFKSETLDNYEIGTKSEWFDHRLRFNMNVWYAIYSDQQMFRTENDPSGALWFHQLNLGKSKYWGVEIETQANPIDGLMIDAAMSYIYNKLTDPGGSGLCVKFANGDPCYSTRTPEWTFSIGASYEFNLGNMGTLTPRIDARYQSKIYFLPYSATLDPANDIAPNPTEGVQSGYTVMNGRITWTSPNTDWEAALYAINLTNKVYFNGKLPLIGSGLGHAQGNVAPPREVGVTLTRHF